MKTVKMFQVLIEWDGEQPPSTWYSRLHKLAGRVRGDKEQSPIERREESGLIFQEGAILCQSEWLARALATYAKYEFGARSVALATVEIQHEFTASETDWQILKRLQSHLGRRGPKPEESAWVVTCLEEMRVSQETSVNPIQCPHCHSPRILARKGERAVYQYEGDDLFTFWLRTRFAGPHFEPTEVCLYDAQKPPAANDLLMDADTQVITGLMFGSAVQDECERNAKMTLDDKLSILDAIYVGRKYTEPKRRQQARVQAVARYFEAGGEPAGVKLHESPVPDFMDAAAMLGERIGVVYKQVQESAK